MGQPVEKLQPFKNSSLYVGSLSKKEAGKRIGEGQCHVHAAPLGERDACVQATRKCLEAGGVLRFPWEPESGFLKVNVHSSVDRYGVIQKVLLNLGILSKRGLTEKVRGVLDELITNAIYHAYRDVAGNRKYSRKKVAELNSSEEILVQYQAQENGIYLSVTDQGGSLTFNDIKENFLRCYTRTDSSQISEKEEGSGLGLYMVFELISHFKLEVTADKLTKVSCWIPEKGQDENENFSFNFIERE